MESKQRHRPGLPRGAGIVLVHQNPSFVIAHSPSAKLLLEFLLSNKHDRTCFSGSEGATPQVFVIYT